MIIRTLPKNTEVKKGDLLRIKGLVHEVTSVTEEPSGNLKVVYERSEKKMEPTSSHGIVVRWP